MFICKYMPLSQFGDSSALLRYRNLAPCAVPLSQFGFLRCPPLATRRLALSASRNPAPCAVRLSQPGALRCPDSHHPAPRAIAHRRRATPSSEERCMRRSSQLAWTRWKRQGAIDRVLPCLCFARASYLVVNFACWIIVVCREATARPARYVRRAS